MATQDVTVAVQRFDDEVLANVKTSEDMRELFERFGVEVVSVADYSAGFELVEKATLIGVPFVIIEANFHEGSYGDAEFVSVEAMTQDEKKVVFNDGSTGVMAQIRRIMKDRVEKGVAPEHANKGILVPGGLTLSEYYRNEKTGATSNKAEGKDWVPARTYYLS